MRRSEIYHLNGVTRRAIGFIGTWDRGSPPNPGGSLEWWTWEVAKRMAAACEVLVCAPQFNGLPTRENHEDVDFLRFPLAADERLLSIAYRIRFFRDPRKPSFASALYRRIYAERAARSFRQQACAAIHIFNHSQYVPVMRRANPQSRIILNMQCDWLVQLDRALIDRQLRGADVIAGCSDYVTDAIRARFPHYADRCRTIYNGADINAFSPRKGNQDESGSERIIFVNRISPEKGLHVLLEAFEKIAERRPKAVLEIIGPDAVLPMEMGISLSDNPVIRDLRRFYRGPYRDGLERCLPSNLNRRVVFSGGLAHQEVAKRMQQSSVLVHPSVFDDPFPLTVLEAMACGLPIVASATGGIPEAVVNGETGLLVERNDPAGLAHAVIRLLDNPALARAMGAAGRARAEAKFAWEQIVESLDTCCFEPSHKTAGCYASN